VSDAAVSPTVDEGERVQTPAQVAAGMAPQEQTSPRGFPTAGAAPVLGSLEERVAARREKLESKTSELFDVPGYEGIFQVELRLLGGKRQFAIIEALERVHSDYQKALAAAADMVVASTVAIHAVVDEEGKTALAEGVTWTRLATAADKNLDPALKPRVALIRLLTENGVLELAGEWRNWMKNRGVKVEQELEKDF